MHAFIDVLEGLHTVASTVGRRRGAIGVLSRHFGYAQVIALLQKALRVRILITGQNMTQFWPSLVPHVFWRM